MKKLLVGITASVVGFASILVASPVYGTTPAFCLQHGFGNCSAYAQTQVGDNNSTGPTTLLEVYGFAAVYPPTSNSDGRPVGAPFLVRVMGKDTASFTVSVSSGTLTALGPAIAHIESGIALETPAQRAVIPSLEFVAGALGSGASVTVPPITNAAETSVGGLNLDISAEWLWTPGPGPATLTATGQAPVSIPVGVATQTPGSFSVSSMWSLYEDVNNVTVVTTGGAETSSNYVADGTVPIGWINPQPGQTVGFTGFPLIGGRISFPSFSSTLPIADPQSSPPTTVAPQPASQPVPAATAPASVPALAPAKSASAAPPISVTLPPTTIAPKPLFPTTTVTPKPVSHKRPIPAVIAAVPVSAHGAFGLPWWLFVIIIAAVAAIVTLIIRHRRKVRRNRVVAGSDLSADFEDEG
jgi:hypothetical protein